MKRLISKTPIVSLVVRDIYRRWMNPPRRFPGSERYWEDRYERGGNSGDGSYERLAAFKAEVLNEFVERENVRSVIEYGCGDGNQLKLAEYPRYNGFDVSAKAIAICRAAFAGDATKTFRMMDEYVGETAELALSLDVIYHLVEDDTFDQYMARLFDSATRFVAIYSSNTDHNPAHQAAHVKHRRFSDWVVVNRPCWELACHMPNRYPFAGDTKTGSFSDFYFFHRYEHGANS